MGTNCGNGDTAQLRTKSGKISRVSSRNRHIVPADTRLGTPLEAVNTQRALEPRILLDAAGVETAEVAMSSLAAEQADTYFRAAPQETPINPVSFTQPYDSGEETASGQMDEPGLQDHGGNDTAPTEIFFIDSAVEDIDELVAGLPDGAEVIVLSSDADGVEQIAEHLEGRSDIDAVHILSHGRAGTLELGSAKLTETSMTGRHADAMAAINDALAPEADILIYGCNFADGTRGASAVEALVRETGADVAASDDLTGAAALGGDWELEVQSGNIETSFLVAETYSHTLAVDGQLIAGEAFARGNYVEMGINANGTFGANDPNRPAGFHDPRTALFGFIANPQQDGWVNYDGDFFTPGTPHAGFILEVNGTSYTNDTAGINQIPGTITDVRTGVLCGQPTVEVEWTGNIAGIEIIRTYTILENEVFILAETQLRNTTGAAINNIFFASQLDPDNDQTIHGDFATTNSIDNQPGGGSNVARVTASQAPGANGSAEPDGSSISLVADDPRARAGYGGFLTNDASDLYNGVGITQTVGSSTFHDESISLAFNIGTLAAGESTVMNYTYLLEGDPSAALACLNLPDAQPDGPVTLGHGSTTNIDVLANDSDPNNDPLTITHIVDPTNPGTQIPITVGSPITLSSGTVVELLGDGTLDVTASSTLGPEVFDYVINDGVTGEAQATVSLNVINTAPVLNLDPDNSAGGADDGGFETTFTENGAGAPIVDSDVTISDPEDDIVEIVVTLTNGQIGDTFDFPSVLPGGVTASVLPVATLTAPGPMTITLTGTAATTSADWNAILQSVTLEPSTNDVHNPDPTQRVITIEASDSQMASSGALTTLVNVVPVNDPPTLDLDDDNSSGINSGNYQGVYVENAPGAPISDGAVITDLDDTNLEGLTIVLTNGQADDILNIGTLPPGITLVGAAPTALTAPGTITVQLTGSATLADYQTAIAAITFANGSDDPVGGVRTITVTGTDGDDPTPTRTAFITVQPVNDPPEVIDPLDPGNPPADPNAVIPAQTGDDSAAVTPLLAAQYFTDPDDTVLTYSLDPSAPAWLSINPTTGEVTGTPPSDASQNSNNGTPGEYDVIIIATDPGGLTAQTTANFTISNPAPDAQDDGFTINENDPAIAGNVLADNGNGSDADPDGDTPLTISEVGGNAANVGLPTAGSTGGLFTIDGNGGFTFADNGDFEDLAAGETRDTTITYQLSDGEGGFDTATVTVTVTGTNDDPTVVPGNEIPDGSGDDAQTITPIETATAFTDADANDVLTYSATGLPSGLSINPTSGQISGTLDGSASQNGNTGPATDGVYTIEVTADDGNGGTVSDTFTFTVSNVPPDAQDDALTGNEDTISTGENVLADNASGADSDADGDTPLTVSQVGGNAANVGTPTAGSAGGLFTIDANGDLTFDPNGDFDNLAVGESATTTITYELSDGEGGIDTATVTYTVTGVNDAPVPVDPTDPGNPPADPNDYIPLQTGADNTPVTPLDVTQYVTDPDASDTLTFTISPAELPPGLMFDGTSISGTLDPNASQGGDDPVGNPGVYEIPLTVTDGNGGTFTATITYDISNPPPVAVDDSMTGDEDTITTGDLFADNGNGTDTDPDGDTFTITRVTGGNNEAALAGIADGTGVGPSTVTGSTGGTFTVNADGTYSFDPGTDFQDLDDGESRVTEIVYQVDDGEGGTDTAVVSFTVTGANDAPVVIDPNDPFPNPNDPPVPTDPDNVIPDVSGSDGQAITPVDVTPYFVDVDGEALTFGFDPLDPDVPAWLSIDPVSGVITGTPPSDASQGGPNSDGVYPITLTATDPDGETVTTTLDFSISNIPPVAVDDTSTGDEDNDQSGNVITDALTGDADGAPDNDPITVTDIDGTPVSTGSPGVVPLTYGTLTMNEDGSWLFEPNAAANQLSDTDPAVVETVTYTIDDGQGGSDTATLEITVNGINDPVQVIDPNDPSTDPTDPTYDPTDPTVIPDPNNLIPDVSATDGETPASIPAGDYFADAEGDTLTFSASDLPSGLTINPATGEITGTIGPDASQNGNGGPGIYNVVITATDPQNNTATTTVTYTVTNVPPTAQDDAVIHSEDGTATGDVFADNGNGVDQDTLPDSDPITVSEVDGAVGNVGAPTAGDNGGTFTINPDGTYTFDPGTDFQDLDDGETRDTSISYTIDDGNGGTDTATITVTVQGANDAPVVIDPNDPFPNPNDPPVPTDPDNVIPDVSATDGETFAPLDVSPYFVDVDGEPLTFGFDPLDPDVPTWLSIDPVSGVITGTPPADASQGGPNSDGVYPITITAEDPDGEIVTTTLDFTITNLPPAAQDDAVTHGEDGVGSGDVFADNGNGVDQDTPPDSDPITVSEVDGTAGNVGTPTAGNGGGQFTINIDGTYDFDPGTDFQDLDDGESRTTSITYTIDDGNGGTDTATITVTVEGANDAPVVIDPNDPFPNPNDPPVPTDPNNVIPDQTAEDASPVTPLNISPFFVDVDGEPLTFGFDPLDPDVPAWLTIDPVTGLITGTPLSDASIGGPNSDGIYPITVTATDPDGETVTTTVDFTITNPPPVTSGLADQTETAGEEFTYPTASSFTDPDGDTLTFTAVGLPAGLTIDPITGEISGTIDGNAVPAAPDGNGTYSVTVTADDGQGGTVDTTFTFKVLDPVNPDNPVPEGPPIDPDPEAEPETGPLVPDLILDRTVNGISSLGGNTGIFEFDHPLTAALFEISPLSEGISLDPNGHPVTEVVEWVEKTRDLLAAGSNDGPSDGETITFAGGDARTSVGGGDFIIRTMVWNGLVFIETVSGDADMIWEVDSINGVSAVREYDRYGKNLIAIQTPERNGGSEIVLIGADRNGNEVILEINLEIIAGQFRGVSASGGEQAAGFSGQLQTLINKPLNEARALLQKTS